MSTISAFCGSFDPVTLGHGRVLAKALDSEITSHVVVGVRNNADKLHLLTQENRTLLFKRSLSDKLAGKIEVTTFSPEEIQKDFAAKFLIRGIRNAEDLDYETANVRKGFKDAANQVTEPLAVLWIFDPSGLRPVSASLARQALLCGSDQLYDYVPEPTAKILLEAVRATRPFSWDPQSLMRFNAFLGDRLNLSM